MNSGILRKISSDAERGTPVWVENFYDEQPSVRDLVLPGSGYRFSDEFACLLRLLCGDDFRRDHFKIGEMK